MMTYISGLLLYVFGLSPGKGNLNYKIVIPGNKHHIDPRSSYTPGYKNEKKHHLPSNHHNYKKHHMENKKKIININMIITKNIIINPIHIVKKS